MTNFTNIQLKIIESMLYIDTLNTSRFVKNMVEKREFTKGWIWQNIYNLEKEGLIERINPEVNQKKNIKHKKLFTKKTLKEKYDIFFVNNKEIEENLDDEITIEEKK
jgi:DNA-binding MarR family transcriptional regulator